MEENIMVEMDAPAIDAPVADTQESGGEEVVNAADLLNEEPTQAETVVEEPPVATVEPQQDDAAPPPKIYTKSEFDEAVRRQAQYIRRGIEQERQKDPYWLAGKRLAEMQAMADGVAPETAIQRVLADGFERQVEALAGDPKALVRAILGQQIGFQPPALQPQQQDPNKEVAQAIANDIRACVQSGELPENFKIDDYTQIYPDFVSDCAEFGVRSAIRTVKALQASQAKQQTVLHKAAINNSLPKPIRPGSSAQETAQIDYTKMSGKEFDRLLDRMHEAHMQGKTVRI